MSHLFCSKSFVGEVSARSNFGANLDEFQTLTCAVSRSVDISGVVKS
jgi:hypothetical protein